MRQPLPSAASATFRKTGCTAAWRRRSASPSMPCCANTRSRRSRRAGFYRPAAAAALAKEIAAAAEVAIPDFGMPIRNLSGGNQQRLVARREMRIAHKVLIAAYPSRGLDVGAINTMLRYIVELRDAGAGIILISEELEELLNLSDRIAVLYEGRIMGIVDTDKVDIDEIGLLMGGRHASPRGRLRWRSTCASSVCPPRRPASPLPRASAAIVLALRLAGIILSLTGANPLDLGLAGDRAPASARVSALEDLGAAADPADPDRAVGRRRPADRRLEYRRRGPVLCRRLWCRRRRSVRARAAGRDPAADVRRRRLSAARVWILVPTLARAYADVNELITTLLLNFVAILLVYYVSTGAWRDRTANSATARLSAEIPEFWGSVHWGLPIAIVVALAVAGLLAFLALGL